MVSAVSTASASALRMLRIAATRQAPALRRADLRGVTPFVRSWQQQSRLSERSTLAVATRSLHSSRPVLGAGESDAELSARLAQEIAYEQETAAAAATESESEAEPSFLATFRKQGIWKIEDVAGSDEIALSRDFGNEHIRVLFSIGDIETTEADVEEAEEVDGKDEEDTPAFPVRCAITISKVRRHRVLHAHT